MLKHKPLNDLYEYIHSEAEKLLTLGIKDSTKLIKVKYKT